jgi:hypothetical protein
MLKSILSNLPWFFTALVFIKTEFFKNTSPYLKFI